MYCVRRLGLPLLISGLLAGAAGAAWGQSLAPPGTGGVAALVHALRVPNGGSFDVVFHWVLPPESGAALPEAHRCHVGALSLDEIESSEA